MKFGKHIQAQQIPGWSQYYLDYKFLKKIVSSLAASRPVAEAPTLAVGMRPGDLLGYNSPGQPTSTFHQHLESPTTLVSSSTPTIPAIITSAMHDDDRGPEFLAHKTRFFRKLESELEKINSFYLQKEAELKLRLATLLRKRKAAARRVLPDGDSPTTVREYVEWRAIEEAFRLLAKDLGKVQHFIEINATGFRKILKKWDKRSKSSTKELYLARQVEIQPVFNRQLIAELSDAVAACLVGLTDMSTTTPGLQDWVASDLASDYPFPQDHLAPTSAFTDLESNVTKAINSQDEIALRAMLNDAKSMAEQPDGRPWVSRILWKAVIDASVELADVIMASPISPLNFEFVDDINGRTCLHEAASTGILRLVNRCINVGLVINRADVYGRTALHYASINGHAPVCSRLLAFGADATVLDKDNYSPLIYAIVNGHTASVQMLLDEGRVAVDLPTVSDQHIPLSLACQHGHVEIARLLLQRNAKNITNTNGEYPIHLAAREGHAEVCRLLVKQEVVDVPDKYHEWTPLFHATRHGHAECVKVLLEAGCSPNTLDETGKEALFYAVWYGHMDCVNLLLYATPKVAERLHRAQAAGSSTLSPSSDLELPNDGDTEMIPSLSLPPPIMPFRVYGHNYLDKTYLIQVSLGHPSSGQDITSSPLIRLMPRFTGSSSYQYPHFIPPLKLVMSSRPDISSAPYSITLPVTDNQDCFCFQLSNIDDLCLEFSFYPSFGSKTIGRALVLPSAFKDRKGELSKAIVLPVLDHRLHVIGQVAFEVCIISPFSAVTLQLGGAIGTYWKSSANPSTSSTTPPQPARPSDTIHTLPPARPIPTASSNNVMLSSLMGEHLHLVVQVTKDLIPVVFSPWKLPVEEFDLGVADLTLGQFEALARRLKRDIGSISQRPVTGIEWRKLIDASLISLGTLFKVLPPSFGISLELAFPTPSIQNEYALGHSHDLNAFVDCTLNAVYHASADLKASDTNAQPPRRFVFSSRSPDICTALNWKQPNYAVFFISDCGASKLLPLGNQLVTSPEDHYCDRRCKSVHGAVGFVKSNNILGLLLHASLLVHEPHLIQAVKESGILLGAYGDPSHLASLSQPTSESSSIDAILQDRMFTFLDYGLQTLG